MNGFDIVVATLAVVLIVMGLANGLVRILVGLASLVVAFFMASRFEPELASRLSSLGMHQGPSRFVAYLGIFLATMIAGGVVAWLVRKLLSAALLGWADRLAGGAAGLVAAALAAAFVLYPVVAYSGHGPRWLGRSRLAPYVAVVSDFANLGAPQDLATRYRTEIESLRRLWRGQHQRHKIVRAAHGLGEITT